MKKPTKSIITSSLLAVAFGALSVGSTFALFTSQSQTEIEVASGIVEVSASSLEFTTYSAQEDANGTLVDENNNKYSSVATAENGVFTNTGTANYNSSTSVLSLERLTPGDRVRLSLAASFGNTNVSIKFRYGIVVDQTKTELAKALDFSIQEGTSTAEPFHGLVSYYSDWIFVSDPAHPEFGPLLFDISMPITAGNQYQNLATSYLFTLQAVQGNAVTSDEKSYSVLGEDVVSAPQAVVENEDTTITAQTAQEEVTSFAVTVPTATAQEPITYYEGETQKTIATNDELTIEVADLGVTKETYSTNTSLNFDLTVKVNGEEANNFSEPLEVKIKVGSDKIITRVQHNGDEVTDFQYDSVEGILSFSSSSFSPFSLDYLDGIEVRNEAELRAALLVGGTIGLKTDIEANTRFAITKDVRIVGFGHTINVTEGGEGARAFDLYGVDGLVINLEDVTIRQSNSNGTSYTRGISMYECEDIELNLLHATVESTYYAINIASSCDNVVVNISDSSVSAGWCSFQTWSSNTTFNINNSVLRGTNDKSYNADGWNNFATIVVNKDVENTVINLTSCTIEANYTTNEQGNHNKQLAFSFRGGVTLVNVNNCVFKVNEEVLDFAENWYPTLCNFTTQEAIEGLVLKLNGAVLYQSEE